MKKEYDFSKGERGKFFLPNSSVEYKEETKSITIRINSTDLEKIKQIASKEGLPYQTYIKSRLHKIAVG
ncbi:MAG: CopG family antitoxin [Lentisphaerota bacterium]